jgi:hypothetical protein
LGVHSQLRLPGEQNRVLAILSLGDCICLEFLARVKRCDAVRHDDVRRQSPKKTKEKNLRARLANRHGNQESEDIDIQRQYKKIISDLRNTKVLQLEEEQFNVRSSSFNVQENQRYVYYDTLKSVHAQLSNHI